MSSNSRSTKWWQILLGLIIIVGLIIGASFVIRWVIKVFSGLQNEVAAAIIAVTGTILVSVISIIVGKYFERKSLIEQELREKKIPMYVGFVEFWFKLLMSEKTTGKKMPEKEMLTYFSKFTKEIMVWGSDEVVSLWSNYRRLLVIPDGGDATFNNIFEFEKLLLAIRKDTGHKNKNIKRGDLLGLFINDIDNYIT